MRLPVASVWVLWPTFSEIPYSRQQYALQHQDHGARHANRLQKAFSSDTGRVNGLRRRAYGNLHMVLAGLFFRAGQQIDFARHALKSLWLTPGNVKRLIGFPLRWYYRENRK